VAFKLFFVLSKLRREHLFFSVPQVLKHLKPRVLTLPRLFTTHDQITPNAARKIIRTLSFIIVPMKSCPAEWSSKFGFRKSCDRVRTHFGSSKSDSGASTTRNPNFARHDGVGGGAGGSRVRVARDGAWLGV
jgi:hypothetical protein